MSGSGLGYLDAAIFASIIPNPVPFTEYKGNADIPVTSQTSSLKVEGGTVRVPSGPGFGVSIDPAFVREAVRVTIVLNQRGDERDGPDSRSFSAMRKNEDDSDRELDTQPG